MSVFGRRDWSRSLVSGLLVTEKIKAVGAADKPALNTTTNCIYVSSIKTQLI